MQPTAAEQAVLDAFASLVGQPDGSRASFAPAPQRDVSCMVGTPHQPVLLRISGGRVAAVVTAPGPLPHYNFAFHAPAEVWLEFWQPLPRPGCHDLFALVKRGEATLVGDLQPLMAHLQFFKDLLALPRLHVGAHA